MRLLFQTGCVQRGCEYGASILACNLCNHLEVIICHLGTGRRATSADSHAPPPALRQVTGAPSPKIPKKCTLVELPAWRRGCFRYRTSCSNNNNNNSNTQIIIIMIIIMTIIIIIIANDLRCSALAANTRSTRTSP